MNKIKVLYDVVKTMKNKETVNGVINIEIAKDETRILSFANEFYRNNLSGDVKAKITKEINIDGKKIKNETEAEFNTKDCPSHKFHHPMHGHDTEHPCLKAKLSRAVFILNILNNLKAEDKDDKTVLALDLNEVIREGKEMHSEFHKNFSEGEVDKSKSGLHHHEFIKQLLCAEYKDAFLNVTVNENSEIEKIEISANGENTIKGSININY